MLVTGGYTGEISGEVRDSILGTQKRIRALISLIGDWLNLSRIEAGETLGPAEAVDLRDVLNETVETLTPLALERKITLDAGTPDSLPPVGGNRDLLAMLFGNLVVNAVKYNRRGGRVTIRSSEKDGTVSVAVEDTGPGIPPDRLPLVFEQFYRVKGGENTEGSGLGLSIARKIAELHSGSIEVESEIGKGTVFTVCLPAYGREGISPERRGEQR
jgi:signal transduction histidine kinase